MNVRIRRYAEATNYAKVLTGVYNGIPKGENGMIINIRIQHNLLNIWEVMIREVI